MLALSSLRVGGPIIPDNRYKGPEQDGQVSAAPAHAL